jgi:tryptophan-rich sensory protein
MKNWLKAILSLALPQIAGLTGAMFTVTGEGSWYRTIEKPEWNPPGWLFGPVWTTLYILMGIAFYLIWTSAADKRIKRPAMAFWLIQLVFNLCWTLIFFYAQQIGYAFAEIVVLWLLILITILLFARISKLAAWLLVPYISWVTFAAVLTYTIWQMNQ